MEQVSITKDSAMNGFSSVQVGRLASISPNTVRGFVRQGFAGPELRGRWSLRQAWALKVLREARRQGAEISAGVAAYDLVRGCDPAKLQELFGVGRCYLVAFGESMILNLVSRERAFDPALREQAMREGVPLVVVDVQAAVNEVTKL